LVQPRGLESAPAREGEALMAEADHMHRAIALSLEMMRSGRDRSAR
jgi:hypothetical protein